MKDKSFDKSKAKKRPKGVPKLDMRKLSGEDKNTSDRNLKPSMLYNRQGNSHSITNPFTQLGRIDNNFIMTLSHRGPLDDQESPT